MGYDYAEIRPRLFQEAEQKLFLSMRDKIFKLLDRAGAVRVEEVMLGHSGDSWTMLAVFDRMVELKEIRELPTGGMGQHRVFVKV